MAAGGAAALIGPKRSPLGLAADFGGFPLYKNSVLVGGVGVIADGVYGFDANFSDTTYDIDENIAWAATNGYAAPSSITADKIEVAGTQFAYSNATNATIKSNPAAAPAFSTAANVGSLTPVTGYFAGTIIAGADLWHRSLRHPPRDDARNSTMSMPMSSPMVREPTAIRPPAAVTPPMSAPR